MTDTARKTILLDCDPGHDDVIALIVASRTTDLVAVTAVAGNAPLDMTARNALMVTELFGIDVPVYAGATRPLVIDPVHAPHVHGVDGLGGTTLPNLTTSAAAGHAANAIIEASHAHENLWVVAVGPLTNVALAMRLEPGLADRLAGISIMGGGIGFGNVSEQAEFNFWFDPHAAQIVMSSGARLIMCGLDLTHQLPMTDADAAEIRALGGERATFVGDVIDYFASRYQELHGGARRGPMHDPCAVLALTHPELFETEELHISVPTDGEHRGMSAADLRHMPSCPPPNTTVCRKIDADAARAHIVSVLAAASHD